MKEKYYVKLGSLIFFSGLIFILISWYRSYPIFMTTIYEKTFSQFSLLTWPGIILCLIGIFMISVYVKNKIIKAIVVSFFPLLLYLPNYYFSYIASSDSGFARSSFQVFQKVGINSEIIPYFEFPAFFTLNEMFFNITALNDKAIALVIFTLFGLLLGIFLFLFFCNLNLDKEKIKIYPSFLVLIYFVGMFSFLNYQWVPQTFALVLLFLLLFLSTFLLNKHITKKNEFKILIILSFTALVYTHAFIPIFFLSFYGFLVIKERYLYQFFIAVFFIYIIFTIYYATFHFDLYIEAFQQSIQGFGNDYETYVVKSTGSSRDTLDFIISLFNRIRVPIIWIISLIGGLILLLKRKINYFPIALGLSAGMYLAVGILYSILGLRSIQILFIPIVIGLMFFILKWRKPTFTLILIILILSISAPMRIAYNQTQFQIDEEANACNFLSDRTPISEENKFAAGQVNYGYLKNRILFSKDFYYPILRPGNPGFFEIFNEKTNKNSYIIYNSNLGKEIINYNMSKEQFNNYLQKTILNNFKIYESGTTLILNGFRNS